jgi:capsular polysaccharide export protein
LKQDKPFLQSCAQGNLAFQDLLTQKSVLLLQGPIGPLFGKLARGLVARGAAVTKVCFSAGDAFDWRDTPEAPAHHYRGTLTEWPAYFENLLSGLGVTAIVLFGQGRRYHSSVTALARQKGVKVFVLEEGYFRPGYVTLEANGVNAYSTTMDDAADLLPYADMMAKPKPETVPWHFTKMAWAAAGHYLAMAWGKSRYPHYEHHRNTSALGYGFYWLRSWLRKALRYHADHRLLSRLHAQEGPLFFVPLQSPEDSQIHLHSRFANIHGFIDEVIHSFANHADPQARLLFKQHPMNRGGQLLDDYIQQMAKDHGIGDRVFFVTEAHNPSLLVRVQGMVLINSTMGLQALSRFIPVKALGESFYDQPGLTDTQALDTFWQNPQPPGAQTTAWLKLLKCRTQVPCSVYALKSEPWQALG